MNITFIIPLTVIGLGAFFAVKLKMFFIIHPIRTLKRFFIALKAPGAFGNLTLALAGTLGVGNIFGVAGGIVIGGAGSVFWLLVASVFSSVIKYAENVMALDSLVISKGKRSGGMMYVMESTFKASGRFYGGLYALLCLLLAFAMGCIFQCFAIFSVAGNNSDRGGLAISAAVTILLFVSLAVGKSRIEKVTSVIIPVATVIYVALLICIIYINRSSLDGALLKIFNDAFSNKAVIGGVGASTFNQAVREGFSKGILSNEAGIGTSAMANIRAEHKSAKDAGLFGMCEVFFDSVVLCTLTGVAILVSVNNISSFSTGAEIITATFNSLPFQHLASGLLAFCICCFAFSTVLCWYHYGNVCREYLFLGKYRYLYITVFVLSIFFSQYFTERTISRIIDILLVFMSFPVAACLIKNSDRIKTLSEK